MRRVLVSVLEAELQVEMTKSVGREFFAGETIEVARQLLGIKLIYKGSEGIIVETEAYKDDAASHAVTRPKKGVMLRETYGRVYIYFIYGMYHCLNFTTEKHGTGAVLIRAIEPTAGIEAMKARRGTDRILNLTNGPGKLFQAFDFDPALHGEAIGKSIRLQRPAAPHKIQIACSPRVGISKAIDLPWRFFIDGNKFVSR